MLLAIVGKTTDFGFELIRVRISALPLSDFVILSKFLTLSLSLFIYKIGILIAPVLQAILSIK